MKNMKMIIVMLAVLTIPFLTLGNPPGSYTGGAKFNYLNVSVNSCPVTITCYYSISGGARSRTVTNTATINVGSSYTFPAPVLSLGEYISSTNFNFSSSGGSGLVSKSILDANQSNPLTYNFYACQNSCRWFSSTSGGAVYNIWVDCMVGG